MQLVKSGGRKKKKRNKMTTQFSQENKDIQNVQALDKFHFNQLKKKVSALSAISEVLTF